MYTYTDAAIAAAAESPTGRHKRDSARPSPGASRPPSDWQALQVTLTHHVKLMGLLKTPIGDLLGPLRLTVTSFKSSEDSDCHYAEIQIFSSVPCTSDVEPKKL